jgi:hypothetical protein
MGIPRYVPTLRDLKPRLRHIAMSEWLTHLAPQLYLAMANWRTCEHVEVVPPPFLPHIFEP